MTDKFCVTALGDWLQACREADVPYVRADRVVEFEVEDLMNWDVEGPHGDRLAKGWRAAQAAEQQNCMFRWDFCASSELKYAMAKPLCGGRFHNSFGKVPTIDDPRVIDIMLEHPRKTVALWRRPWVQARVIDEYPLEYRVFVEDGEIAGISNYYPQRPIPRYSHELAVLRIFVSDLIFALDGRTLQMPGAHETAQLSFTADFLVREENDRVMFLEGGPPHRVEGGAHPCCFRPGEIDGIALSDRNDKPPG